MRDTGKPNPIVDTISNVVGAIRADDDMHELAKAHDALAPKAIEKLSAAEARRQPTIADAVASVLRAQGRDTTPESLVPGVTREDIAIPTANGALHAFVYRPDGARNARVIVYFHGGGWVIADAEVYDAGARGLAKQANAIVVSVDYRQAPEHRFPAAWDDAISSYQWVAAHAAELGGDPTRLALAGESAGGNLAVATAVAARDTGVIQPRHVLAVYPVAQTGSLHTESYIENAIAKPLNKAMIEWFVSHLINSDEDKQDPRLDLVHADLSGLPPVTIINATLDPLRSDGGILEKALTQAGVPVERRIYTGVAHEFFGAAAVVEKAAEAQAYAGERLRASFV
ncbi:alpha/beta hydrolase [Luteimonas fraxinea]|uniref:Alpha/beta hydrolase n=1 Tax=Luteimonas fraxinea TaxID=2901869 RepID=A0ABS8U7Q6_9GAMM|nr:alpha/beta hydrolase [Luteimonas fraxinea]MCD9095668.1 alpha/beta hydrolase [Luteimonas fraxinea]UHH11140.1 alpha/beta hydrolase [Luteimonas fraxinea]